MRISIDQVDQRPIVTASRFAAGVTAMPPSTAPTRRRTLVCREGHTAEQGAFGDRLVRAVIRAKNHVGSSSSSISARF
jgi:hypothetical protein